MAKINGKRLIISPASRITNDVRLYVKVQLLAEIAANDAVEHRSNWRVIRNDQTIAAMIGEPMTCEEALQTVHFR